MIIRFLMLDNFIIDQNGVMRDIKNVYENNISVIGEFSGFFKKRNEYILYRDHLGCRKLFYAFNKKKILISKNFIDLANKVTNKKNIKSVAPGYFLKLSSNGLTKEKKKIEKINFSINKKKILSFYLKSIKKYFGDKCIVCLSGGLDSTVIAKYAKSIFKEVVLVTIVFDYDKKNASYNDLDSSQKIASSLKLKHIIIYEKSYKIFKNLKRILYACQDWRDFNVHCASLNFFIAKYLSNKKDLQKSVILTGDFMNEYCADYTTENFFGEKFYITPNLPKKTLQRFFTLGLDSSNREVGVFNYFGLKVFQPYNCLKDFYFKLSEKQISRKNSKYIINFDFINKSLINLINKSKIRAQVGNTNDGGILGVFFKKGYTKSKIKKLFSKYFKFKSTWQDNFIRLGTYKT